LTFCIQRIAVRPRCPHPIDNTDDIDDSPKIDDIDDVDDAHGKILTGQLRRIKKELVLASSFVLQVS
jgi:hypothetical protein